MAFLDDYQQEAVKKMKNGCILCGDTGSGKSRTGLSYYFLQQGGKLENARECDISNGRPLYIITTAKKRDTYEWEDEMRPFGIEAKVIDSWNNIEKYEKVKGAFFIFDEQRVCGYGKWSKTFIKIARNNQWILLTATPGDTWLDYVPVFIANGFYKGKTDFEEQHVVYNRFTKFKQVRLYLQKGKLIKHRNDILIEMDYHTPNELNHFNITVDYDAKLYKWVLKERKNPETGVPFRDASGLCYYLRKIVNLSNDRIDKTIDIASRHKRIIIFYSFDYEVDIIKRAFKNLPFDIAEWNGHKHEEIPKSDSWIYLVNYSAGAEGWNCTKTDTMIFYSQSYSYKMSIQAAGRINRRNTPFKKLYYYHLRSNSSIDISIAKSLKSKKNFNENMFITETR